MNEIPNPGSEAAGEAGCTCPVIDNHYGNGRPGPNGRRVFIYVEGCPVHTDTFPITEDRV